MVTKVLGYIFCLGAVLLVVSVGVGAETDGDGDGLSDFQEVHKYFTDPDKRDSDADGIGDGDWHERREYAYTVRTVVKVMRPCNAEVINDDYQDAHVLSETEDYVELEVIHYPFNTNAEAIEGSGDWREQAEGVSEYLEPGITTNWDEQMREDMVAALEANDISLEKLTDKELVERVSRWLMDRSRYLDKVFTTYYVYFPNGEASIYPGLEGAFEHEFARDCNNYDWPIEEHFEHELMGRGMFYDKIHGSCTSFAVYLTAVLRAAGISTRMVLAIPVVDTTDQEQIRMIEEHISHNEVRATLLRAMRGLRGFSAHTFNEVYVGGRWRRLNYSKLGQNTYGDGAMGMLTHVHTFGDLSEAGFAATWGVRYGKGERDETFEHGNPYRTTEVSDRFGLHCKMENPEVKVPKVVTITKAYWFFSDERPEWIKEESVEKNEDGHILVRVDASYDDLQLVYPKLEKVFFFRAEGQPEVRAMAERGYWSSECYVRIPVEEYTKMKAGIAYRIVPAGAEGEYRWKVADGVTISRPVLPGLEQ